MYGVYLRDSVHLKIHNIVKMRFSQLKTIKAAQTEKSK